MRTRREHPDDPLPPRPAPTLGVGTSYLVLTAVALALLRALEADRGPRRDERIISAIALVGRGMLTILIVHLSMLDAPAAVTRSALALNAMTAALAVLTLGLIHTMLRHGPRARAHVPSAWSAAPDTGPVRAA